MRPDLHIDAAMGCAGDMLLGALIDAGVDPAHIGECITAVVPDLAITTTEVSRSGLRALALGVGAGPDQPTRTWAAIRELIADAALPEPVATRAQRAFAALAAAEGRVHGHPPEDVHFHEVGAVDSIADIVGVCAAVADLDPVRITAGPVGVGRGTTGPTAHGVLPVPAPAVLELFAGTRAVLQPGPAQGEACTPTAAALLVTIVDEWTDGPVGSVVAVGLGAGAADPPGHPNVTRVILVDPQDTGTVPPASGTAVVLETNVDDLDPRLWPDVLAVLLAEGAADAWLTPILMKKGRPAHMLSVLCRPDQEEALTTTILRHTPAIGLRSVRVGKRAADRELVTVSVGGHAIAVKIARWQGAVVNIQPEYRDVRSAAAGLARPLKEVLAAAISAANRLDIHREHIFSPGNREAL